MRNLILTLAVVLATPALAVERYLGVITATTAKNQTDTAVPFTIPKGARIVIDCDALAYMRFVTATTGAATTGAYNRKATFWETYNGNLYQYLSILAVAGTVNCQVSEVLN